MKTLVAGLLSLLCLTSAWAESPATPLENVGLAEELLTLLHVEKSMDVSLAQVTKVQDQMMAALPPEARARQQEAMKAALKETLPSWDTLKPIFVEIYASTFTAEELKELIAFFRSPIGQVWLSKQPEVQSKTMEKMQAIILQAQPKMMEAIMRVMQAPAKTP